VSTDPDSVRFRAPRVSDGAPMFRLAERSDRLDCNSAYFYLLFASRFAPTSVVAEGPDGALLGFVAGLLWPDDPRCVFVWQVGVDERARGARVASRMLDALVAAEACAGVTHLESTVTPGNEASLALFRSLARRRDTRCEESDFLAAGDFPPGVAHEPERLLRIGPF